MIVLNKRVACKPPAVKQNRVTVTRGVGQIQQKHELLELEVVFGNEYQQPINIFSSSTLLPQPSLSVGSKVYVRGDSITAPWCKEVYEKDGNQFVLVPYESILAMEPVPTSFPISPVAGGHDLGAGEFKGGTCELRSYPGPYPDPENK